jgi:hypothetical protein
MPITARPAAVKSAALSVTSVVTAEAVLEDDGRKAARDGGPARWPAGSRTHARRYVAPSNRAGKRPFSR